MENLAKLMDLHGGVAAWVQAIGALLALGLTIYLSRGDRKAREKTERARGRSAALALFPVMMDILGELSWALAQVEKGHRPEEIGCRGPEDEDTIRFWQTPVMPDKLIAMLPLLHELGDAAEPSQRAYFALQQLKRDFLEFMELQRIDGPPEEAWCYSANEWKRTHALAVAAERSIQHALASISAFLK